MKYYRVTYHPVNNPEQAETRIMSMTTVNNLLCNWAYTVTKATEISGKK